MTRQIGSYAKGTRVPVEKSRAEIRAMLDQAGATAYQDGWIAQPRYMAAIMFEAQGRRFRFVLDLPAPDDDSVKYVKHGTTSRRLRTPAEARAALEQQTRERWRALVLQIHGQLIAVYNGTKTLEEALFYEIVLPDRRTVGEVLKPQVHESYRTQTMPPLLPGIDPASLPPGSPPQIQG